MNRDDQLYYSQRAEQERASAKRCEDSAARMVHETLANRYAELAESFLLKQPEA